MITWEGSPGSTKYTSESNDSRGTWEPLQCGWRGRKRIGGGAAKGRRDDGRANGPQVSYFATVYINGNAIAPANGEHSQSIVLIHLFRLLLFVLCGLGVHGCCLGCTCVSCFLKSASSTTSICSLIHPGGGRMEKFREERREKREERREKRERINEKKREKETH